MIKYEKRIDIFAGAVPPVVYLSQYDSDFTLEFELYSSQGEFTLESGTTVAIRGTKKDGNGYSVDATLSGTKVTVAGDQQMTACAGEQQFELTLYKGEKELNTCNFILSVERAALDKGTLPSKSVIRELVNVIDRTDEIIEAADTAETAYENALGKVQEILDSNAATDKLSLEAIAKATNVNEQLDMQTTNPVNVFDGAYSAVLPPSSASGSDTANDNNSTTDFIEAEYGDKVFCGYTGNVTQPLTSYNPVFITEYDANKQWLYRSSQFPATDDENGKKIYTITQAETKYIRVSFANSMVTTSGRLFEIAINIDTSTYIYYTNYFEPYTTSKRLYDIEHLLGADIESKIIDCWGDSRTEMIAGESTSFCDYLQTLLGDTYNVCNYGISSQSSGMCAARLGSNEVFATLAGNQIPASGEVALTGIKCSSGNNRNLYAYSATAYIPCMLNGVAGRLSRASISTYDNVKFLRDSDGAAVRVVPRTKIVVPDMGSKHHICVLWWGKNDFDSAGNYVVSGILDNYAKAVEYLGHKKYVILGETCSIKTSYEAGGADRAKLDTINATLTETYPDNYIDINAWLSSEEALTSVGLTATATDLEYIEKGFPCYQLMVYSTNTSDTTHPNEKGRQAIANKVYSWMHEKGWV